MNEEIILSAFDENVLSNLGIAAYGVTYDAKATSYDRYQSWIEKGGAHYLDYLKDERMEKRSSLHAVFPEFKSALVFLFPYSKFSAGLNSLKIADYVMSFVDQDYHQILPEKMINLISSTIDDKELKYKVVVDTLPVLERDLAFRSGLGWFGKNSMLINKKLGSYFLIGSVLFNKKIIIQDRPSTIFEVDHCGSCRACIEACPTEAIDEEKRQLKVDKCISSYTIELFTYEKTPPSGSEKTHEIFGCDICQSVCPWNNKIQEEKIDLKSQIGNFFLNSPIDEIYQNLKKMSKREFRRKFKNTPLERTGRDAMLKNIETFLK